MTSAPENRLKNSASPYLRSAAHQPIDWNEWGEEAFAKGARRRKTGPARYRRGLVPLVPCDRPRELRKSRNRGDDQQPLHSREGGPRRAARRGRALSVRRQRDFRAGRLAAHGVSHAGRKTVLRRHLLPARRRRRPSRFQTHPARDFRSVQSAPRGSGQLRECARRSRRQGRSLSGRARRVRCARD